MAENVGNVKQMVVGILALVVAMGTQEKPQTLLENIGGFHRAVVTGNSKSQRWFDQGLVALYGYDYRTAKRSFQQGINEDPSCAMNYWGLAFSYGPDINFPEVSGPDSKLALEALDKADRALAATRLERQLIAAQKLRFSPDGPKNRNQLNAAYADAMRRIWMANPKDPDVGALFAESILDCHPWDQWTLAGAPKAGTLEAKRALEDVLKINPRHPMGLHLYIHTIEGSQHPEVALSAANTLFNLTPELSHMQHMPCHIYARMGLWEQARDANIDALVKVGREMRSLGYDLTTFPKYGHYDSALAFAAGMLGQSKIALNALTLKGFSVAKLLENHSNDDTGICMPLQIQQMFGKWDDILAAESFTSKLPFSESMRLGARSIAFAVKGNSEEAKKEYQKFLDQRKQVKDELAGGVNSTQTLLEVEQHLVAGELWARDSETSERGIQELRKAVELEDRLRYTEPPEWLMPTRHALGAALLYLSKYKDAEVVYRENLRRIPNDGWALIGLSKSLRGQKKVKEADRYESLFKKAWAHADIKINTSCLCFDQGN